VKEFTAVVADYQTGGKGQRGNSWESEDGKNLLFSIIFFPDFIPIQSQFLLSQIVSLAVKKELDTICTGFSIKWPNDIYWGKKKICGMLLENDLQGSNWIKSIAGIGVNVNQEKFHSQAPNPISLYQITGQKYDIWPILSGIVDRIIAYYDKLWNNNTEEITAEYRKSLFRNEGFHLYKDPEGYFEAEIDKIMPDGAMILRDNNGRFRKYYFKEVEYIL